MPALPRAEAGMVVLGLSRVPEIARTPKISAFMRFRSAL